MVAFFVVAFLLSLSSSSFSQECRPGFLENMDFPGSDLTFLFSPSAEHCQKLCTQHPSCLFFTFIRPDWTRDNTFFRCYLKSTPSGEPASQTPLQGATSGFSLKACSQDLQPCFSETFENVDFPGADYRALFTPDYEECQRACTQDPGCQFFTFLKGDFSGTNFRFKCHLKFSWSLPVIPDIEKRAGLVSGFSQRAEIIPELFYIACQSSLLPNTDIPGSDLIKLKAVSPEHCQVLCSAHPQCTYFSFVSDDFSCYLKNNGNEMVTTAKNGVISGMPTRSCQVDENWIKLTYEEIDFKGFDIRSEVLDDAAACQRLCTETPACQFYTYINENSSDQAARRRCFLKSVITIPAPPAVTKLDNVVSGFTLRNCLT
ncbi:coagulation factor XI [Austrofundulus limnaeus]|uniref:Coagulation factor XI n=1 Tax=Austrofundulus limnaeus TaxID=52670 RepID=A0A2I4CU47_AUSLI|nr:PREDICTED: coagulation factor XI-like [Austrofundulus limnaeus]